MDDERPTKRKPLTLAEVREAFEPLVHKYPPLLSLEQAAELSGYTPASLKRKLSEGDFRDAARRGKPLLFWRDRFVLELMNRPWSPGSRPIGKPDEELTTEPAGGDREAR